MWRQSTAVMGASKSQMPPYGSPVSFRNTSRHTRPAHTEKGMTSKNSTPARCSTSSANSDPIEHSQGVLSSKISQTNHFYFWFQERVCHPDWMLSAYLFKAVILAMQHSEPAIRVSSSSHEVGIVKAMFLQHGRLALRGRRTSQRNAEESRQAGGHADQGAVPQRRAPVPQDLPSSTHMIPGPSHVLKAGRYSK